MLQAAEVPETGAKLIDLGAGRPSHAQIAEALANMAAALMRFHTPLDARLAMADAFAGVFARWAVESGRPAVLLFAMECALRNAVSDAQVEAARRPAAGPGSAA